MKNIFCFPALFLILCYFPAATTAIADELPISGNFSAEYILRSGLFDIGKTNRTLNIKKNGQYVFTSKTRATGMFAMFFNGKVTERSIWEYKEGRARPVSYNFNDTNNKKRNLSITFDWDKKISTHKYNGKKKELKLTPDTQDKLSYQINIMLDLMENKKNKEIKINVADRRKLRSYNAMIQEKESIKTPAGKFETIRISHDDGKRVTTLWCAPSLNYLPVRIEHYKKSDTKVNAYLTRVNGLPKNSVFASNGKKNKINGKTKGN